MARPEPRIYPKGLQIEVDLSDLPKQVDRIHWLKQVLDQGEIPEVPRQSLRGIEELKTWRKVPQRGNRPFNEHSLSQLRDDPEGNEY